jgi:hypothetical protein
MHSWFGVRSRRSEVGRRSDNFTHTKTGVLTQTQRMMLYPSHWDPNEVDEYDEALGLTPIARLLQQAQSQYYVKLRPVEVLHQHNTEQETWADSYTKLLAFNLTEFDRVLAIDSDSVVKANLPR